MSILDWVILGFTALLALYGYAQGFLVGALSLAGFAVGGFLGTRIAPLLLHAGQRPSDAPLFTLVGALLVGGVCASGLEAFGGRLRARLRVPGFRTLDGLLGALLTGCVALGIAWIAGAIALDTSSSPPLRSDIDGSQILRALDRVLPPSQLVIGALSHLDPQPTVHGPAANVAAPSPAILATAGARAAGASVVKVYGMACGLGIEGSGWVVAPDLIVTNAHVVAGERDTEIQVRGVGPATPVAVVAFDVRDDLAVLRVRALPLAPLAMAPDARAGESVAILGYPLDGPFRARAGRLGQIQDVSTQNAYGEGHVMREIAALRGTVKPGNSGGPLVDARGRVRATVFAAITGTSRPGGFAIPDDVVRAVVARARRQRLPVSTGHCAE
ncbi:MAG TPA: MarP family serine protease [Solirubrobacteraceae bacterium]|nr:MarP family serine protease [Solirubrobacteraceae bacterium]